MASVLQNQIFNSDLPDSRSGARTSRPATSQSCMAVDSFIFLKKKEEEQVAFLEALLGGGCSLRYEVFT